MTTSSDDSPKVIARECRFAIHIPERRDINPDLHMVKEQVHYSDGRIVPEVRFIRDFKRKFWITKPNKRSYKDKREWEHLDNLLEKETTQSRLRDEVAKMLDKHWSRDRLKQLAVSPYLYGTDISSTSLVKKAYMDKFPDANTPYSVAFFDIETDVINGTDDPILASLVFKNDAYIVATKDFIQGIACVEDMLQKACQKYIGEYLEKHDMKVTLFIADTPVDLIRAVMNRAHKHKPDFLAIWNMDFDIPRLIATLEKYGVDPSDIFCDPSVPKNVRICKYKQGPKKKVTASGKVIPINPAAQWHTLVLTSSFYVIDAMCSYKHLRLGEQEKARYSLDFILGEELGIRKLKFKEADAYSGLAWHQFMQKSFKIEYMVYNIFDSLSMLELDQQTKDLAFRLPSFSVTSDFAQFKSQPRRIADALHFNVLETGNVMGTVADTVDAENSDLQRYTGDEDLGESAQPEEEEEDNIGNEVLDRTGWILTLPPHNSVLGLPFIEEDETIRTGIRGFVYDSDATSAYPSSTSVANVSKSTTKREIITIEGVDEYVFRMNNLNAVLGQTNANEYCQEMFCLPRPEDLLKLYQGT